MTREEFKVRLADRVEQEFSGMTRREDGQFRPSLDRRDCEFIAALVFSEIGQSGLGLYDVNSEEHR